MNLTEEQQQKAIGMVFMYEHHDGEEVCYEYLSPIFLDGELFFLFDDTVERIRSMYMDGDPSEDMLTEENKDYVLVEGVMGNITRKDVVRDPTPTLLVKAELFITISSDVEEGVLNITPPLSSYTARNIKEEIPDLLARWEREWRKFNGND